MIVTALVNTTYKRKPVSAGTVFDCDDEYAAVMIKERKLKAGGKVENEDEEDADFTELKDLKADQLKAMAKDLGIAGYANLRKEDLIAAIEAKQAADKADK